MTDPASLSREIADAATASDDGEGFLTRFGPAMVSLGLPLWRFVASMPALDATASHFSMGWTRDGDVTMLRTAHGPDEDKVFLDSPVRALRDRGLMRGRWRLDALRPEDVYPILAELRDGGGTDYLVHLVPFSPGTALRGVALSFATQAAEGFSDRDLDMIDALLPALGLAMAKFALAHTLRRTLGTYLGTAAGEQVLGGRILRGEGRTIPAAILLVDLRGFTKLTDESEAGDVVGWLNEHLDALGEPVLAGGGEILKFLGDGFLAVFPVSEAAAYPCRDCEKALTAALEAARANQALNERRKAEGRPALEADIVLHYGEVVFGNVGTRQRLDFTVIGRAVNEASRIEKNCEVLGHAILVSDSFATRCHRPLARVGEVSLRGLTRPQAVWTVTDRETRPAGKDAEKG